MPRLTRYLDPGVAPGEVDGSRQSEAGRQQLLGQDSVEEGLHYYSRRIIVLLAKVMVRTPK